MVEHKRQRRQRRVIVPRSALVMSRAHFLRGLGAPTIDRNASLARAWADMTSAGVLRLQSGDIAA